MTKKLSLCFILCFALALLFGCGTMDVDKAKEKLKEDGYTIMDLNDFGLNLEADSVAGSFTVSKGLNSCRVVIFEEASDAKEFAEKLKESSSKLVVEIKRGAVIYDDNEDFVKEVKKAL